MPILKRLRVLAAKIEVTSGTAETVTASDAAFNAYDIMMQPNIAFSERTSQGTFSYLPGTLGGRGGTCTFKVDLVGDGAAGIPSWATTFLPACGMVAAAQVYSPVSSSPGASVKTLTIAVYENGMRKVLRGCSGTFKLSMKAGQIAVFDFTFTGIYGTETDATILAPDYPSIIPMRWAASTFTIGGSSPGCVESMEIDLGNTVILRECPTPSDASGYESALITNRRVVGKMNPEQRLVATDPVFAGFLAGTEYALSCATTATGDTITIAAPKIQRTNVQEGERNGMVTQEIDFQCGRSADAGDDELTITFA